MTNISPVVNRNIVTRLISDIYKALTYAYRANFANDSNRKRMTKVPLVHGFVLITLFDSDVSFGRIVYVATWLSIEGLIR